MTPYVLAKVKSTFCVNTTPDADCDIYIDMPVGDEFFVFAKVDDARCVSGVGYVAFVYDGPNAIPFVVDSGLVDIENDSALPEFESKEALND